MVTMGSGQAADDGKYPNWKGQWQRLRHNAIKGPSTGC
jgi:hypothetical protein